ncbi:MAG: glycosyltransferase [Pseudomonadales bacterium]|nr:glycosyltransferase [Pseudomonadales bacterium]MCK5792491.1 glycosyltransferase [Ketobacter sp.]TNC90874.1 MAG: glycosyltransferase [Alcanivorax sp.]HAG92802.1 glycosyltransferase [Gammaproteobacteria bacterium]MAQ24012.1 glycosyltransferase [Pseudomonadales bacterium]|tara:strand:- start:4105 stop:5226 length:1122 start_codon:yes stop_codon:yes gene_type:complete
MSDTVKVLQFICPTGFYGAERWILTLAKNLDRQQVQCDLAVTVEPDLPELEVEKQYKLLAGATHKLAMSGRFDLSVIRKLCQLIRREGYQIIHTHGYKSDILGLIAARLTGITALSTPHGFENADDWKLKAYIGVGNRFLRWFDGVAPLSEQLCKDMDTIGVRRSKVHYIQNGVDLDEVERCRVDPATLPKSRKRIGFIGQMISRKNIFELLDIFEDIASRHDDVELKLLGDGDQRVELEQYAATLTARERIEFLGFRDDRLDWLKSFDLFVMTSTLEGIPRCLMETMAMGVPVTAYNIAGIDQLLTHNETGLLAELGDKQSLTRHWEAVLYDEKRARELADNARQYVMDHFSGHRMAQEYDALFKKLLAKTG